VALRDYSADGVQSAGRLRRLRQQAIHHKDGLAFGILVIVEDVFKYDRQNRTVPRAVYRTLIVGH
jgi:hypothetical protein